jgi:hypothetical protein
MVNNGKRVCVYSALETSILQRFSRMVGREIDCGLLFNDSMPDWTGWETPWFLGYKDPNYTWGTWADAPGTSRQLILSQSLIPKSLADSDWRQAGARGDYAEHARSLARNLIAARLGNIVIRFAGEANGDWNRDNIGDSDRDFALWRQFWRQTVLAMKSVPGANFRFDWSVNAAVRPIPLGKWYPGDDVVDIVGIDAYDSGFGGDPPGLTRWSKLYTQPMGIRDVLAFAKARGKPLSIPEWGVAPRSTLNSAGDDPYYVDGIASVVRNNRVAYQSYFYNHDFATQLATGPLSLAAYRAHFASGGDSVGSDVPVSPPASPPSLSITTGPRDGSTITTPATSFTFEVRSGATTLCSLDVQPLRACSGPGVDHVSRLTQGTHIWTVETSDLSHNVVRLRRHFIVNLGRRASPAILQRFQTAALVNAQAAARHLARRGLSRRRGKAVRIRTWVPAAGRACVKVIRRRSAAAAATCGNRIAIASGQRQFAGAGHGFLVLRVRHGAWRLRKGRREPLLVVSTCEPAHGPRVTKIRRVRVAVTH